VLRLRPNRGGRAVLPRSGSWMFAILVVLRTHSAAIAVPQVKPDCPIWAQYLANPAEHIDQLRDVLLRCRLQPDLSFDALIPTAGVGWSRDHALHRLRRQDVCHALGLVAVNDGHLRRLLFSASSLFLRDPRVRLRRPTDENPAVLEQTADDLLSGKLEDLVPLLK